MGQPFPFFIFSIYFSFPAPIGADYSKIEGLKIQAAATAVVRFARM